MKKDKLKVSIIMGIYNCENTLSDAIESILNQSLKEWELIMCDDCSTDNTIKVAEEYVNKFENIKLLKNNMNRGLAFSLNRCLSISTGKYIARMDSDDISLNKRLKTQVDFLENNSQYGVVGSSIILFDEKGEHSIRQIVEIPTKYNLINSVPHIHPTIMMRKEIYDKLNGYTVSNRTMRGQDLDLWFRFYANGFKGFNIREPLLKYHEGINDYKKRSLKKAINSTKTMYLGYKMLNIPKRYYINLLKPIIAALIPNRIMYIYHKRLNKN